MELNGLYAGAIFFLLIYLTESAKYLVTDEAWFQLKVQDYHGPMQHLTGIFTIALFGKIAPKTVSNFVELTKGYKDIDNTFLHYNNTIVHRVLEDFIIQMGDVLKHDGSSGKSIYGFQFEDETFLLSNRGPGWVGMSNKGPDTNGSQFYILFSKARWLDNKHVVFGKVIRGMEFLNKVNSLPINQESARPKRRVTVVDCGVSSFTKPWELEIEKLDSLEDIATPN